MKFLFVLYVLQATAVTFGSGQEYLQSKPDLATITTKIIKSCYGERVGVIGMAGNLSDNFITAISSGDPISTVLLNRNERAVQSGAVTRWSRYKLQVFAVMVTSSLELEEVLLDLKNSRWWNHMAQFYIFNSSDMGTGCSEAYRFLWTAWMMNILGAKFICNHDVEGPLIYTFNPYTAFAPKPWKFVKSHRGVNEHPWTLLVRNYSEKVDICKTIDFDQTKDAGGYEVRHAMSKFEIVPSGSKSNRFIRFTAQDKYLQAMWRYMNISWNIFLYSEDKSLGFIDDEGKGHGMLADLTNGRADIISRYTSQQSIPEVRATYPILYGKYYAVTQNTPYLSQWQKLMSAIDGHSRIGSCIVFTVTVFFLKYGLKQSFGIAILNTIRMICNSCFTKLPNNLGPRIYLACLFSFVVVIQALYQGQWAALLTKQIRYPNVNNKQDLVNSDYILYGRQNDSKVFSDLAFERRFVGIEENSENCIDFLLRNSSIVCVSGRSRLLKSVLKLKLHMSKYPVNEFALSQPVRRDWPLEERFNRHTFHYVESGTQAHDYESTYAEDQRTLDVIRNEEDDDSFKVIVVKDLDFAFMILGVGLGCAIVSFVVELYIGRRDYAKKIGLFKIRPKLTIT